MIFLAARQSPTWYEYRHISFSAFWRHRLESFRVARTLSLDVQKHALEAHLIASIALYHADMDYRQVVP